MKNIVAIPRRADAPIEAAEQLSLLPNHEVAARFRLAEETRQCGLRHIAEIREMLAERDTAAAKNLVHRLPPRTRRAA
jgi:hypothetical protein